MSSLAPENQAITHKKVWLLAGPMIVSNISVPLVGAVDTAVVGHLGEIHFIGAVAVGALIFSFLYWGFGFLRMGTTGFVAQAFGRNDAQEISLIFMRAVGLALVIGAGLIAIGQPVIELALVLIDSSDQVEHYAQQYAQIRVFSAPATLCLFAFTGVLIGMQNTRGALVLQLVLNLSNILLDLLFVPVLNMGVAGVAWATLISEYLAVFVGLYLLKDVARRAYRDCKRRQIWDRAAIKTLMQANGDIFVRTLCLVFAFAYFTAQGAKLGELYLAMNAILLHFQSMMAYALDGFAFAAEALVGGAYGQRDRSRFIKAVRLSAFWAVLSAAIVAAAYGVFGAGLVRLFTDQQPVLDLARVYLPWLVVLPLVSVWGFVLDGIFVGTTHTNAMRNAMLFSTGVYLLCVAILVPIWANHGLLLSLCIFMAVRALSLWRKYPGILAKLSG